MRETTSAGVLGLFLAAGLAGAAYLLADAVKSIPAGNRFVTVKGLADKLRELAHQKNSGSLWARVPPVGTLVQPLAWPQRACVLDEAFASAAPC